MPLTHWPELLANSADVHDHGHLLPIAHSAPWAVTTRRVVFTHWPRRGGEPRRLRLEDACTLRFRACGAFVEGSGDSRWRDPTAARCSTSCRLPSARQRDRVHGADGRSLRGVHCRRERSVAAAGGGLHTPRGREAARLQRRGRPRRVPARSPRRRACFSFESLPRASSSGSSQHAQ